MDTDAATGTVTAISTFQDGLRDEMTRLRGNVDGLVGTNWQGGSAEQFREKINELLSQMDTHLNSFDELRSRLDREIQQWNQIGTTF